MNRLQTIFTLSVVLLINNVTHGQKAATVLTTAEKEQAIERVCELLTRFYVFPEKAEHMTLHIKARQENGVFAEVTGTEAFARAVTAELRLIQNDKHLMLFVGDNPDEQLLRERIMNSVLRRYDQKQAHYGMTKVEILEENVGYMNLLSVMNSEEARNVLDTALRFLSDCEAIIIDLRFNRGGDPSFMAYMLSYFFEEPTHINSIYWRDRDRTDEFWTRTDIPGKKMYRTPLYVLINKNTFSGGEELAYDLQALKRAVIIGEPSAGGAHPSSSWVVYEDLRISIPFGRAINPVTGSNWEETGVIPDIQTEPENALRVAIGMAANAAARHRAEVRDSLNAYFTDCFSNLEKAKPLFLNDSRSKGESLVSDWLTKGVNHAYLDESTINRIGYDYLGRSDHLLAIAVFKANVLLFPESANAHDSLGEAYLASGDRESAASNYEKALEIDPDFSSARRALAELRKQ